MYQKVTGFTDMAPVVREQTLKSVLVVIGKLSDRTINGDLLKQLAKAANDEQPGIRTNTTICLGKIAKNLGTSTRSKVLIAAFTRSLRDPFVHARNAALMALAATTEHFNEEDSAVRILPVVCPALVDKEKLVRDQAARTMDVYLQKIRKAAAAMPDSALPPVQAADSQPARMGTPQPSGSSGWTGWAISSFTNKMSAAAGEMENAGSSSAPSPIVTPPPGPEARRLPTASASSLHRQAIKSPPPTSSGVSSPNANAAAEAFFPDENGDDAGDSWGDMGDNDDAFESQPKSTTKATSTTASATPFDDGEPDFEGWLAAQAKKKSPLTKSLPKGLSKPTTAKKNTAKPITKTTNKSTTAKKIDLKPKETDEDEGWGDGW